MDKYKELISLLPDCPEDITPQELAKTFNEENDANYDLAAETNRLCAWLDRIFRFSRGKAREWAREALGSENTVLEYFNIEHL